MISTIGILLLTSLVSGCADEFSGTIKSKKKECYSEVDPGKKIDPNKPGYCAPSRECEVGFGYDTENCGNAKVCCDIIPNYTIGENCVPYEQKELELQPAISGKVRLKKKCSGDWEQLSKDKVCCISYPKVKVNQACSWKDYKNKNIKAGLITYETNCSINDQIFIAPGNENVDEDNYVCCSKRNIIN